MITDPKLIALLTKLAEEEGLTIEDLIGKMASELDSDKHVVWHTSEGFIRVKCYRSDCFEKRTRPTSNIRD